MDGDKKKSTIIVTVLIVAVIAAGISAYMSFTPEKGKVGPPLTSGSGEPTGGKAGLKGGE